MNSQLSNCRMGELQNYYVKADLEDYADLDELLDDDAEEYRSPTLGRSEILEKALDLERDVDFDSYCTGGYQGTYLFVFEKGGYLWLLKDSYGSCSYCDGLLASENSASYGISMMRNAYAFENENDAVRFLHMASDRDADHDLMSYSWQKVGEQGIKLIDELEVDL